MVDYLVVALQHPSGGWVAVLPDCVGVTGRATSMQHAIDRATAQAREFCAIVVGIKKAMPAPCELGDAQRNYRWAKEYASAHGPLPVGTVEAVVSRGLVNASLRLTPDHVHGTFEALARNAGTSEFVHRTDTLYTSAKILQDENLLLRAGRTTVIPAASEENFENAVAAYNAAVQAGEKAHPLDAGQIELARQFATSPTLLGIGIGAAGTGKSTAMGLVRAAITAAGGHIIGLAPSAIAAANLGEQLGVTAATTEKFLLINQDTNTTGQTARLSTPGRWAAPARSKLCRACRSTSGSSSA